MANRKQRRAELKQPQGKIVNVRLKDITFPWDMNEDQYAFAFKTRAQDNFDETGHPFHHKTANGVIVTPDPTLEYFLKHIQNYPIHKTIVDHFQKVASVCDMRIDIPHVIPVNRKYYGHDIYERH